MTGIAPAVATMRAGVLEAPRQLRRARVETPRPGPGEILLRVEGCGVCGSNVSTWEGRPWFGYPLPPGAPGHEAWGRVEALGAGVDAPAVGARVTGLTYRSFAEHDVARAEHLVRIPEELDGDPVPGEALGCAINVFERTGIGRGDRVAVVGVGFLGALLVQLAAAAGARVLAVSRRSFARATALACGAGEAVALDADVPDESFDVVVEAAGVQETLDVAARLVRARGRLVVAGFHQDGPRQIDLQSWNWRGLDVVNAHERDPRVIVDGIRAAVGAVAAGRLDPAPLYTHVFPLDRLHEALEAASVRPDGFLKALVVPA